MSNDVSDDKRRCYRKLWVAIMDEKNGDKMCEPLCVYVDTDVILERPLNRYVSTTLLLLGNYIDVNVDAE